MKILKILKNGALILLISIVMLLVLEGIARLFIPSSNFKDQRVIAETIHTEYDPLLGWNNKPNFHYKDMYGENKPITINSQSFRNKKDTQIQKLAGKKRWLCVGDSFTLGFGVGDEETWCSLLDQNNSNLETVNLGQGGYGMDQSFLRYKRDGTPLDHDLVIFAFITPDIAHRMFLNELGDFPKPYFKMEKKKLSLKNTPVPRQPFIIRQLFGMRSNFKKSRLLRWIKKHVYKKPPAQKKEEISPQELASIVMSMLAELHQLAREKSSHVVLVHLPFEGDIHDESSGKLRRTLYSMAKQNEWDYLDLIQDFHKLSPELKSKIFIKEDIGNISGAKGHYTVEGNQFIAYLINKHL